jgi:hypothetical protein
MFQSDPSAEEFPVTLQLALCAKDGWILASDTKESRHPYPFPGVDERPPNIRTSSSVAKIIIRSDLKIVYMTAGERIARECARQLLREYEETWPAADKTQVFLEDAVEPFVRDKRKRKQRLLTFGWIVMVIENHIPLWKISVSRRARSTPIL